MNGQAELAFYDNADVERALEGASDDGPVENIECEGKRWRYTVSLRASNGIWLWGVDWWSERGLSGGGFYPFKKWGPEHASATKEGAINAATAYCREEIQTAEESATRRC